MMKSARTTADADEARTTALAQRIALKLKPGDLVTLSGALGAGKTTFARALIRAFVGDAEAEVPSPTFSLVQTYEAARFGLAHLDLYRLADASEIDELGLDDLLHRGAVIVEWPERVPSLAARDRLDVSFAEGSAADRRDVAMLGHGSWVARLDRLTAIDNFLSVVPPWAGAEMRYLQGDASARAYARLRDGGNAAVLMDAPRLPDGPPIRDGLPYSRIAHLAEDVMPFVAVAGALETAGLSVPRIYAADLDRGLLLLEDFGDRVFGRELAAGNDQCELWGAATDALAHLHRTPVPLTLALPDGGAYALPRQDRGVLAIEAELLVDWYWPALYGESIPEDARGAFTEAWAGVFDRLLALPSGVVLRDYHSPNLMWLPDRAGHRRVGVIDFQDALQGPAAYDLVSLLQDARLDVPADIETVMLARYCDKAMSDQSAFDRDAFSFAYAALGAQRNTKILGIFARLARRDDKPAYLRHIPRLWRYLERDLSHPDLGALRAWFDRHLPPSRRAQSLEP